MANEVVVAYCEENDMRGPCALANVTQYWVVYAFLSVIESLVNAVYWFRKFGNDWTVCCGANKSQRSTTSSSSS